MKKTVIAAFIIILTLQITGIIAYADPSSTFALPEKLLNAEKLGSKLTEEEDGAIVLYAPTEEEDLEYYINLSNLCGTYCYQEEDDFCFLMRPEETEPVGNILYDEENKLLGVRVLFDAEGHLYTRDEEDMKPVLELFDRDLILPEGSGKNTFPQFYTCSPSGPYHQTTQDFGFFDGVEGWTEYYDGITAVDLRHYTTYMMLFGFDLRIESVSKMDDGNTMHVLHYSNGEAEVYVLYTTETQDAIVTYKPGVTYYLLSASELDAALGGN